MAARNKTKLASPQLCQALCKHVEPLKRPKQSLTKALSMAHTVRFRCAVSWVFPCECRERESTAGSRHGAVLNIGCSLYVCYLFNTARHLGFLGFLLPGRKCQAVSVEIESLGIWFWGGCIALLLVALVQNIKAHSCLASFSCAKWKGLFILDTK